MAEAGEQAPRVRAEEQVAMGESHQVQAVAEEEDWDESAVDKG